MVLCDKPRAGGVGWGRGREVQEGADMGILTADSCCLWQKQTQHCKAVTLQLKIKNKNA